MAKHIYVLGLSDKIGKSSPAHKKGFHVSASLLSWRHSSHKTLQNHEHFSKDDGSLGSVIYDWLQINVIEYLYSASSKYLLRGALYAGQYDVKCHYERISLIGWQN